MLRSPDLLDVGIAHRWVGMYEVTPDHNALLGQSSGISRFLYACGFSGHGFKFASVMGSALADLAALQAKAKLSPVNRQRVVAEAVRNLGKHTSLGG